MNVTSNIEDGCDPIVGRWGGGNGAATLPTTLRGNAAQTRGSNVVHNLGSGRRPNVERRGGGNGAGTSPATLAAVEVDGE